MKDEFDLWLEGELGKGYVPFSSTPPPAGAPYRAITYSYDSQSRKITRSVATTSGGPVTTGKLLYDGWNCIAEYTGTSLSKTYLWGLDLSGTLQGAGGVGGVVGVVGTGAGAA